MARDIKFYLGVFDAETKILGATRAAREAGLDIYDCYTPYAVHGMDEAMGLPRTKLGWVSLAGGLLGLLTAVGMQYWTMTVDWPMNVGGKPYTATLAYVPIAFELTVLFCGLISLVGLLVMGKLKPSFSPSYIGRAGGTNDRYILALRSVNGSLDTSRADSILRQHGAAESKWYEEKN